MPQQSQSVEASGRGGSWKDAGPLLHVGRLMKIVWWYRLHSPARSIGGQVSSIAVPRISISQAPAQGASLLSVNLSWKYPHRISQVCLLVSDPIKWSTKADHRNGLRFSCILKSYFPLGSYWGIVSSPHPPISAPISLHKSSLCLGYLHLAKWSLDSRLRLVLVLIRSYTEDLVIHQHLLLRIFLLVLWFVDSGMVEGVCLWSWLCFSVAGEDRTGLVSMNVCVCIYVYICACLYECVFLYEYVCIYVYICICVCMYVYWCLTLHYVILKRVEALPGGGFFFFSF